MHGPIATDALLDTDAISEAASKNRRGRPRALAPWQEEYAARNYPKATVRHRRTLVYAFNALSALTGGDGVLPQFRWLCHGERMRPERLAELHLLQRDCGFTDEDVRFVAAHLCDTTPNAKRAAAALRRQRLDSKT